MPDLYIFLGGFMVSLALIGFAFTAGRNYEKRKLRERTVNVAAGTVMVAGEAVDIPAQAVPLAVLIDAYDRQFTAYVEKPDRR